MRAHTCTYGLDEIPSIVLRVLCVRVCMHIPSMTDERWGHIKCVSDEHKREISWCVKRRQSLFLERYVPRAMAVETEEKTKCRRHRIDIRGPAAGCPVFFPVFFFFFFYSFFPETLDPEPY